MERDIFTKRYEWMEGFEVYYLGMATKSISVVTHPNQTQFDRFSPFWLGLSFPQFRNTDMGRVMGI